MILLNYYEWRRKRKVKHSRETAVKYIKYYFKCKEFELENRLIPIFEDIYIKFVNMANYEMEIRKSDLTFYKKIKNDSKKSKKSFGKLNTKEGSKKKK